MKSVQMTGQKFLIPIWLNLFHLPLMALGATVTEEPSAQTLPNPEPQCVHLFQGTSKIDLGQLDPQKSGVRKAWQKTGSSERKMAVRLDIRDLKSANLRPKELERTLLYLLRYTGYSGHIRQRSVVEDSAMVLAYPIHVGGEEAWRLVVEYRYNPGIFKAPPHDPTIPLQEPSLVIDKIWLASSKGDDLGQVELQGRINDGHGDVVVIAPTSERNGRMASMWDVLQTWAESLTPDKKDKDKKKPDLNAAKLIDELRKVETEEDLDPVSKLVAQMELIANATKDPVVAADMRKTIESIQHLTLYREISGPIMAAYRKFMVAYLFTSNRNIIPRSIEDLQSLEDDKDLGALQKQMRWGNRWQRFVEQTARKVFAIPAAVVIGGVAVWWYSTWQGLPPVRASSMPPTAVREVLSLPEHAQWAPKITLRHKDKTLEFINHYDGDDEDRNNRLVPLNQTLPYWQKNDITLTTATGENITYDIIDATDESGPAVYLSPR